MPNKLQPQDQFSDQEKEHINYLGSILHVEPSEEEQEQQRIFDAFDKARKRER